MSSGVFDDRDEWRKSLYLKREPGDFTPFYAIIAVCTVLAVFLLVLNISFCCSRYREYWCDPNTGNRWILPIWSKTPDKQPPLDLTELNEEYIPKPPLVPYYEYPDNYSDYQSTNYPQEFLELQQQPPFKRESDL